MREEIMGRHHLFWLRPEWAASCYFVDRQACDKSLSTNHTKQHENHFNQVMENRGLVGTERLWSCDPNDAPIADLITQGDP